MTRARLPAAIALLSLTATACIGGAPGDDLAQVLPDDRLLINMPTGDMAAKEDREWSEFYLLTAQVTDDVNGLIAVVLVMVDTVTEYPASAVADDGNSATWGPWSDALDPVETALHVVYAPDTDTYTWSFVSKPKGADDEAYVSVIAGEVDAGATDSVHSGRFWIDFDAIHELDPNHAATGRFGSEYAVDESGVAAIALFEQFADGGETVDAAYAYQQIHGGEGAMDLAWVGATGADGQDQAFLVRSRWLADGQGRSDAVVAEEGEGAGALSECWDATFAPVYQANSWEGEVYGDASACAYDAAEYPTDE